jgi:hypothetical protein
LATREWYPYGIPYIQYFGQNIFAISRKKILSRNDKLNTYPVYINDILIIHDSNKTTAQDILIAHNNMHTSIKYNLEVEHKGSINFLDLKIHRHSDEISIGVYHKPTFTDVMIPAQSNHPMHHKISGFTYMLYRANKLPMSKEEHNKEICTVKTTAENKGYNMETLMKAHGKHKNRSNNTQDSQNNDRKIWTRFTYFGDEIRT